MDANKSMLVLTLFVDVFASDCDDIASAMLASRSFFDLVSEAFISITS